MLIVRVELHSAITGKVTELARMAIANTATGTPERGNYNAITYRGRSKAALDRRNLQRSGTVRDYPRKALHVWNLVARALSALSYS